MNLWTKPIIAYGVTITPEQQAAAWSDWLAEPKCFDHPFLAECLVNRGVPNSRRLPAHRAASRMLQIARKAGVIRFWHGRWMLVEQGDPV